MKAMREYLAGKEENIIDRADFLIREEEMPINEIAADIHGQTSAGAFGLHPGDLGRVGSQDFGLFGMGAELDRGGPVLKVDPTGGQLRRDLARASHERLTITG